MLEAILIIIIAILGYLVYTYSSECETKKMHIGFLSESNYNLREIRAELGEKISSQEKENYSLNINIDVYRKKLDETRTKIVTEMARNYSLESQLSVLEHENLLALEEEEVEVEETLNEYLLYFLEQRESNE